MKEIAALVGAVVMVGLIIMVFPIIGFLGGAFSGLMVGWVFDETMATFIAYVGIELAPWQVGGMLGFVGGFFKSSLSTKKDDD